MEMPDIRNPYNTRIHEPGIRFQYRPIWRLKQRLIKIKERANGYLVGILWILHDALLYYHRRRR
jgi:hypothetical protein